jgi:hypothetical protein
MIRVVSRDHCFYVEESEKKNPTKHDRRKSSYGRVIVMCLLFQMLKTPFSHKLTFS